MRPFGFQPLCKHHPTPLEQRSPFSHTGSCSTTCASRMCTDGSCKPHMRNTPPHHTEHAGRFCGRTLRGRWSLHYPKRFHAAESSRQHPPQVARHSQTSVGTEPLYWHSLGVAKGAQRNRNRISPSFFISVVSCEVCEFLCVCWISDKYKQNSTKERETQGAIKIKLRRGNPNVVGGMVLTHLRELRLVTMPETAVLDAMHGLDNCPEREFHCWALKCLKQSRKSAIQYIAIHSMDFFVSLRRFRISTYFNFNHIIGTTL